MHEGVRIGLIILLKLPVHLILCFTKILPTIENYIAMLCLMCPIKLLKYIKDTVNITRKLICTYMVKFNHNLNIKLLDAFHLRNKM